MRAEEVRSKERKMGRRRKDMRERERERERVVRKWREKREKRREKRGESIRFGAYKRALSSLCAPAQCLAP